MIKSREKAMNSTITLCIALTRVVSSFLRRIRHPAMSSREQSVYFYNDRKIPKSSFFLPLTSLRQLGLTGIG